MKKEMFENAHKLVVALEEKGCKVAVVCVGVSTITVKALYAGVWFEYAYADNKLVVTCNGQVIEEMVYEL